MARPNSAVDRSMIVGRAGTLILEASITIPRVMVPELQAAQHRPEPEPPEIPIDWRVPSSDLADWPTTVGHNRELERAELETIVKAIKERVRSVHMLVGEAGSGNGAPAVPAGRH